MFTTFLFVSLWKLNFSILGPPIYLKTSKLNFTNTYSHCDICLYWNIIYYNLIGILLEQNLVDIDTPWTYS